MWKYNKVDRVFACMKLRVVVADAKSQRKIASGLRRRVRTDPETSAEVVQLGVLLCVCILIGRRQIFRVVEVY